MKKYMISAFCFVSALMFASCNSDTQTQNNEQQAVNGTPQVAPDSALTEDKQELLMFAARNNMLQVELGRLAVSKGSTDNVQEYGQQLVDWYSNKQNELQELAQQYNVSLPTSMNDEQTEHIKEIQEADANEFDSEYWESVTDAQKEAISHYEDNLNDIEEANATAFSLWARNTLKELQAQREAAESMAFELNNRDGGISRNIRNDNSN
ncbi:DUF4142 domain-containing protein [Pontibacter silvestris]|uniref:DUF4142 domain-containing protein n=1 Tax=Pontibacter silvestris TaxID=2305183 RepID=A0ABW4WTD7_9BACT|nr:DUF4142 domain-containing protein [Pontibacter silvestris]MCC9138055.1 DUF4142 domain-containing protein [Pontibacter silvestris]